MFLLSLTAFQCPALATQKVGRKGWGVNAALGQVLSLLYSGLLIRHLTEFETNRLYRACSRGGRGGLGAYSIRIDPYAHEKTDN